MPIPGYRDIFSCLYCHKSGEGTDEFKCSGCGSYVCQHLVLIDGGLVICFCCHKDQKREWPAWWYVRVPEEPEN